MHPPETDRAELERADPGRAELAAPRRFAALFALAALTGGAAGTLATAFHLAADNVQALRLFLVSHSGGLAWAASMLATAALTWLAVWAVRRFAPEAGGSGIQEVEGALAGLRPFRWARVLLVKFAAGAAALGSGLALGREGPTIQMGAALGRLTAWLFGRDAPYARHCLAASGAGAGLAAAFGAPLAGVLFVVEEMREHFHFDFVSFHCVVVACAAAQVACLLLAGPGQAIPMPVLPDPDTASLALFLAFGLTVGLAGTAFNACLTRTLDLFEPLAARPRLTAALAVGALTGLCAWAWPISAGGGHATLSAVLDHALAGPAWSLLALFALRFPLTMLSYASGAPGGIFAPMLALGTLWGVFFGAAAQGLFPGACPPPDAFAVAGMGALFAATVRAPMTGMVLILEMTRNYQLTLPLMLACITAAATAASLGTRPIYRVLLERVLARESATPPI
ncbi:H(+)/Cl(-) exchange transporter ClcA [Fundidesulfovibrio magnetotacticus]|uniref:H(+)/Cl(-) exchange transporter ClcA n=1 Tax=Fundidesulfovibrio magnetotacticus TaxID=2730080 RepID=A0A6V8LSY2_9BACT|nr:H(+)/Cl(-) exchange transporter ClcA [Fundidesulfovibrio magnetotacticus]GFK95582.1 H(+)/Cl(-) exchange transporter ClcA [Fundidesulfovibrio magnetotacticus]